MNKAKPGDKKSVFPDSASASENDGNDNPYTQQDTVLEK